MVGPQSLDQSYGTWAAGAGGRATGGLIGLAVYPHPHACSKPQAWHDFFRFVAMAPGYLVTPPRCYSLGDIAFVDFGTLNHSEASLCEQIPSRHEIHSKFI